MFGLDDQGSVQCVDQGFCWICEVHGIWVKLGFGLDCGYGVLLCWGIYPSSMLTAYIETELELAGG